MTRIYVRRIFALSIILLQLIFELTGSTNFTKIETAQAIGPTTEPLVQLSDLQYVGAFRLPTSAGTGSDFQYGAGNMVYNPANNSLYIEGRGGFVAEIGIPTIVNSNNFSALNVGTILQPFAQIDDQNLKLVNNPYDMGIRSLYLDGNRLVYGFTSYYDAAYSQTSSFAYRPINLSTTGQGHGPYKVGSIFPGHVGRITSIPSEWQQLFGGPALTGNFGLPIITRESWGPAGFVFDPAQLGVINPTQAQVALDYPDASHSLGPWDGTSNIWNISSTFAGMAFIAGTRTILYAGTHGIGTFCYGDGGVLGECYDPESGDKGSHAYPYVYRIWAYDANDLLAVKQGTKQSWEPQPYGAWNLNLPTTGATHVMPTIAYDPITQRLFVVQGMGPNDASNGFPIIHVYNVGAGGPIPPPPPAPTPTPTPSPPVPLPPPIPPPVPLPTPLPPPPYIPSPTPTAVPSPSPSPIYSPPPTSPVYLPEDGTLIKDISGPAIFVMEYGKKRPFASFGIFTGLGYKYSNVKIMNTSDIPSGDGIFTSNLRHPRGSVVLLGGTVYYLGANLRYACTTPEIFFSWNHQFKDLVVANTWDIAIPQGEHVQMHY